ncbi:MAG: DUF2203 domain-containing protein [Acidimicrobiales bacterium]|nr:DUF2203 domain-containing protein [Acidimicrobiales bacterium]
MSRRVWTLEEANAALGRVAAIVEQAQAALVASRAAVTRVRSNGHKNPADPEGLLRQAVEELAADGIVLRDAERGLVDFPARSPSGRDYWLCWLVGEPEVAWWHWPEAGFAGRRPVEELPD